MKLQYKIKVKDVDVEHIDGALRLFNLDNYSVTSTNADHRVYNVPLSKYELLFIQMTVKSAKITKDAVVDTA